MARSRGWVVGVASVLGSFLVYGAHVACGPGLGPKGVATAPAQTSSAPSSTATPPATGTVPTAATEGCGCGASPAKTTASFAVSGDEKIVLDPSDSSAEIEVSYARGPGGKKTVLLYAVVRAYRSDLPSEHPTTLALRVLLPEGGAQPASPKDLEAYVTTWGGTGPQYAPRAYATITKSALTYAVTGESIEIKGSLTLKDVPAGKSLTLDKLALKKSGGGLLPARAGAFRTP